MGLGPITRWDCGFEFRRGHRCLLCVLYVLSGRGLCDELIPRSEYGVLEGDLKIPTMRIFGPTRPVEA
jgi:hypothetical protein